MPIPFILWGLGAVAVAGLGLGAKAVSDNSDANDINEDAESISYRAEKKLENKKKSINKSLENYGEQKLDAFETKIGKFISLYDKLHNVEISRSTELDNLQLGEFSSVKIADIKQSYNALSSMTQGFSSGMAGGALVAYGAYTGTMAFAAASTGTAIASLSGVAATNATLAWLGGGALSAGGAGMAGGAMVLGGLVAGPALLIFGGIFAAKASQKLSEARSNKIKSQDYADEIDLVCDKLEMIQEVTTLASSVLSNLSAKARRANASLENIINTSGTDYSIFSETDKNTVFKSVKYAQLIKAVIDSPILNKEGGIDNNTRREFEKFNSQLGIS